MIGLGARLGVAVAVVGVVATVGCEGAGRVGVEELTVVEAGGSRPTVALAEGGVVLVAWVDGGGDVRLARVESGEVVEVVRANDIAGDAAAHEQAPVQVATGPDGEVVVVWQNNREVPGRRFPASDLRLARSADGGRTFSPAVTVNDDAGGPPASHTFHDMVIAPTGTVHVSWIDGRVEAGGDTASGPQIRVASSRDGGLTFGASVVVAERACPCCRTSLALAPDGRLAVGWRTVRGEGIRDVAVSVSADGGRSWGEPVLVHEDGWRIDGCPHAGPSLSWDAAGRLNVAWYTGAEGRQGLFVSVSDGAVAMFGAPFALLSGEWVPPSLVSLAHGEGGDLWVAWDDRRAEPQLVRVGRVGAGGVADVTERAGRAPSVVVAGGVGALAHSDGVAVRLRVWRP